MSDGCGRSVVQKAQHTGYGNVGRTARVGCWNEAKFDPPADGVLADVVAIVIQVSVNLSDGSGRKSVSAHGDYLHFCD